MEPGIITLNNVSKHYLVVDKTPQNVLQEISLTIPQGQFVAIVGPSGNGKSTLLNLIAGIDRPSSGVILVNGVAINELSENKLAIWRRANLGIVFQFFQLLPALNLLQNVMLPMDFYNKLPKRQRRQRARDLLAMVGLEQAENRLPGAISGGQQQRVAIARALANDPPLIIADEPTGNLDVETSNDVFGLFKLLNGQGKTLVMVTHNESLSDAADRKLVLLAGKIQSDSVISA